MRNIRLTLEYEGTKYAGWQVQKTVPTVQGMVIDAVRKITDTPDVQVTGASRTDAGVHAWGQVANFHTASAIPLEGIQRGLNSLLPRDIVVKEAAEAATEFCSRRSSIGKIYVYKILNRPWPSALLRRWTWHVPKPLDIDAMRKASEHLIGEKDFSSFHAVDTDAEHSVREVTAIAIERKEEDVVEVEVRGTAFLRHMIRIMAGTLVNVGTGKLSPSEIPSILERKDRTAAPLTAPAQGLILMKVVY